MWYVLKHLNLYIGINVEINRLKMFNPSNFM